MEHPTLLRPPPRDPAQALIENNLAVTEMAVLGPDIYTNARPPYHPPGARGIYGGSVVAMSLAAGQRTVGPDFAPHSCHCYFLLAGQADIPMLFHVERVRDGRSFATRTVQARQRGRCILTLTASFVRLPAAGGGGGGGAATRTSPLPLTPPLTPPMDNVVRHAAAMPASRPPVPSAGFRDVEVVEHRFLRAFGLGGDSDGGDGDDAAALRPVMAGPMRIVGGHDAPPHLQKTQQWVRMRGTISAAGGRAAHLAALAYLTDRYFIGTICRIHRLWRLPFSVESALGEEAPTAATMTAERASSDAYIRGNPQLWPLIREYVEVEGGGMPLEAYRGRPAVGMVVSLDHTMYFHEPDRVRADEWMLAEMDSPWADEGRGVVTQRIFNQDGLLLATCIQEGIVRIRQDPGAATDAAAKAKM